VAEVRGGGPDEGGDGATVVTFGDSGRSP
jgi:dsDNA-specific endonuclease/ATPase MutS2